ncbi:MAG: hypothetical protein WA208_00125 [Thermoanaerobaculia bacterium]
MEGRALLECGECSRKRQISGELPEEYIRSFHTAVHEDGWAPRPGNDHMLICGACLRNYAGHETMDDEEKVQGRKNLKEP